jgi:uncharacterized membrane protein
MAKTIDRAFVRLIATKRIVTGILSLLFGFAALLWVLARQGQVGEAKFMLAVFFAITFGGGVWTLRDGLRLRAELRKEA